MCFECADTSLTPCFIKSCLGSQYAAYLNKSSKYLSCFILYSVLLDNMVADMCWTQNILQILKPLNTFVTVPDMALPLDSERHFPVSAPAISEFVPLAEPVPVSTEPSLDESLLRSDVPLSTPFSFSQVCRYSLWMTLVYRLTLVDLTVTTSYVFISHDSSVLQMFSSPLILLSYKSFADLYNFSSCLFDRRLEEAQGHLHQAGLVYRLVLHMWDRAVLSQPSTRSPLCHTLCHTTSTVMTIQQLPHSDSHSALTLIKCSLSCLSARIRRIIIMLTLTPVKVSCVIMWLWSVLDSNLSWSVMSLWSNICRDNCDEHLASSRATNMLLLILLPHFWVFK